MAARAVSSLAKDKQDDNEHDRRERDDREHLHPERRALRLRRFLFHVAPSSRSVSEFTRHPVFMKPSCRKANVAYIYGVPKLWTATIEAHRREVRDAILDAASSLVAEHGLRAVTMSQIAEQTGIGRATLYKYFPDVDAILLAWHERQIAAHLEYVAEVREQAGDAGERLAAVLEAYALILHESHGRHNTELATFLHRGDQVVRAQQQLRVMIRDLLAERSEAGDVRDDVAPDELATYCLHALGAASSLRSKPAVRRLVAVTLGGLRPPR
jgi:AcrR family transcriptional regulator